MPFAACHNAEFCYDECRYAVVMLSGIMPSGVMLNVIASLVSLLDGFGATVVENFRRHFAQSWPPSLSGV